MVIAVVERQKRFKSIGSGEILHARDSRPRRVQIDRGIIHAMRYTPGGGRSQTISVFCFDL